MNDFFKLMASLRFGTETELVNATVCFNDYVPDSGEYNFDSVKGRVMAIEAEDGSGHNWNVTLLLKDSTRSKTYFVATH